MIPFIFSSSTKGPFTTPPTGTPSLNLTNTKIISQGDVDGLGWHGRTAVEEVNGVMVLLYADMPTHFNTTGGVLRIKFSNDYGDTWSDQDKYLDGSDIIGFPFRSDDWTAAEGASEPWLIACPNGDLLAISWAIDFIGGTSKASYGSRSTDKGKTWGTPYRITVENLPANIGSGSTFMTNDHFIINGVIYLSSWGTDIIAGKQQSIFLKSSDNGVTWEYVSNISDQDDNDLNNYEAGLCYVGNNKIVSLCRNGEHTGTLYKTSSDLGQTWSDFTDVTAWGLTARHRPRQRSRLMSRNRWWEDPYIITPVFIVRTPGQSEDRQNAIQISNDFGVTFPYVLPLDDEYPDAGYNDIFYDPLKREYVVVGYRGPAIGQPGGDIVQYNFKIEWS